MRQSLAQAPGSGEQQREKTEAVSTRDERKGRFPIARRDKRLQSIARTLGGPPVDPLRSRIMRAVGRENTAPELLVRRTLHRMGLRFRLHCKDLPGTPDIVLPKHRTVIFVHGCFWHRHRGCRRASTPTIRAAYWQRRFAANVARDRRVRQALRKAGWRVLTVWECQTRFDESLRKRLAQQILQSITIRS
ncbi:MAG: DNA mismatch endonuclease Vsr [Rhodospirillales bacterium]|nr:DNA mismatch endonuclease Vsr [Rhodospirillales bacterium]